jgi:microsomal epoxide hydrolase
MIRATLQMPTNSALAVFLGSLTADHRPALARIDRPTLIVVARVPAWMSFYEDLQRRIRGARMEVFETGGHALFVEEAARFNSLLDGFLREEVLNRANAPRERRQPSEPRERRRS